MIGGTNILQSVLITAGLTRIKLKRKRRNRSFALVYIIRISLWVTESPALAHPALPVPKSGFTDDAGFHCADLSSQSLANAIQRVCMTIQRD